MKSLDDGALCAAVEEMMRGLIDADLGGYIVKKRVALPGRGKSGGVRVIYFNRLTNGEIWLLTLYSKKQTVQLSKKTLQALVEKLNDSFND